MSACKTGCGALALPDSHLCETCARTWVDSGECVRLGAICKEDWHNDVRLQRIRVCAMDFCNRTRAERSVRTNEVKT